MCVCVNKFYILSSIPFPPHCAKHLSSFTPLSPSILVLHTEICNLNSSVPWVSYLRSDCFSATRCTSGYWYHSYLAWLFLVLAITFTEGDRSLW